MSPPRLGPYEILSHLGRGGMGEVYEALDTATGQRVAVKTLAAHLGGNQALRHRFDSEIAALKALRHPGIVQLLAFGEEEGRPFFAMELVPGKSLEQSLRDGRRYSWHETVILAAEIARALKFAHDHGVVHRDLKPANLLLLDEPRDGVSVKLADFGIARLFGDAGQTSAGMVVGTAEYMAPEQATGGTVDHRADLYATGLVMFAMLTGRPPFTGDEAARIISRQRTEPAPRVSSQVAGIPPPLDDLIDRLLAKVPARRPANALVIQRMLTAIDSLHADTGTSAAAGMNLLAATLDMPAASAAGAAVDVALPHAQPTHAAAATPAQPQTREIGGADSVQGSPTPGRNRFTTVAELDAQIAALAHLDATIARRRQASGVLAATGVLALSVLLAVRPPSPADLDRRITAIEADSAADPRDARPLIDDFLNRFPTDPRAERIARLGHRLDVDALERRARRRPVPGRVLPPLERDYRAAMERATDSPTAALAALDAIVAVRRPSAGGVTPPEATSEEALWIALVRRQIERLAPLADRERQEDIARATATLAEAADLARQAATETNAVRRGELRAKRHSLLSGFVEVFADRPHAEASVAEARRLLAAGQRDDSTAATPPTAPAPESP